MSLITEEQVELQSIEWFKELGYFSLSETFGKHKTKTAVCENARTVV